MHYLKFLRLARKDPASISDAAAAGVHVATRKAQQNALCQLLLRVEQFGEKGVLEIMCTVWLIFCASFVLSSHFVHWDALETVAWTCFACSLALAAVSARLLSMQRAHELSGLLSERDDDSCEDAVYVCAKAPQAADFCKSVVSRGDPIRYFHFLRMREIRHAAQQAATMEKAKTDALLARDSRMESCRKLHGIA